MPIFKKHAQFRALDRFFRLQKESDRHSFGAYASLDITPYPHGKHQKKKRWNWWKVILLCVIFFFYHELVLLSTRLEIDKQGIPVEGDVRSEAIYLTKLFEWMFVPGPVAQEVPDHPGTYTLPATELASWGVNVILYMIGWGSLISVPTYLINSALEKAEVHEERLRDEFNMRQAKIADARAVGRLEVPYPRFSAVVTHSPDSLVPALIASTATTLKPWVVVQTGTDKKFAEETEYHVFLPDVTHAADYDRLLHAEHLSGQAVIILASRSGQKFLADVRYDSSLDLDAGKCLTIVEHIRRRTKISPKVLIVGPSQASIYSETFAHVKRQGPGDGITLENVASHLGADFVDCDIAILRAMTTAGRGKPIAIEFIGSPDFVDSSTIQLTRVLKQKGAPKPHIIQDKEKAIGGVFFIGASDAESVAFSREQLIQLPTSVPRFVIVEQMDRVDEVEALGFQAICIDYVLMRELIARL